MKSTYAWLLGPVMTSALAAGQLACGSSKNAPVASQPTASATSAHGETVGMGGMCPMNVPGTKVSVADTADGVAITFTTTGDVAQLRDRVHHRAAMHEHMMGGGMMGGGMMGGGMMGGGMMGGGMMGSGGMGGSGGMMGSGGTMMVPSTARAEDIDGGARIVLTPKDPSQLSEIRAHVHEHAARMASGHCPMMGHHG